MSQTEQTYEELCIEFRLTGLLLFLLSGLAVAFTLSEIVLFHVGHSEYGYYFYPVLLSIYLIAVWINKLHVRKFEGKKAGLIEALNETS